MYFHFHPYKPFVYEKCKTLIVGTLPPYRFCTKQLKNKDVDFCYGSQDNLLWQVLNEIYNLNLLFNNSNEAIIQRKEFLYSKQIGICDIVSSCKREKIDASDLGMKEVKLRDILTYLNKYKKVNTLIFTGGYCKNSPEYFLRQILKAKNIDFVLEDENIPKIHKFTYEKRVIKTISLTSPSNAANRSIGANLYYKEQKKKNKDYNTYDFRINQYKKIFNKF